ncbi:tripartite motif-containing protein 2-like [Saccoglossus kowalevskii]
MADAKRVQISKDEFDERFLTCKLCEEPYNDEEKIPKYLPCLHTYCKSCLSSHIGTTMEFDCPECRQKTQTPHSGVDGIPNNFIIQNQRQYFVTQEKVTKKLFIPCQSCNRNQDASAISFCMNCRAFLCNLCDEAHAYSLGLKTHELKPMEELTKYSIDESMLRRKTYCSRGINHKNQELTLFCDSQACQSAICLQCAFLDHNKADGHQPIEIEKALGKYTGIIQKKLEVLEKRSNVLKTLIREVDAEQANLKDSSTNEQKEITNFFDQLFRKLEIRKTELLSEVKKQEDLVESCLNSEMNDLELELTVTNSTAEFAEHALKHSSDIELLTAKDDISSQMDKVSSKVISPHVVKVEEFPHCFHQKDVPECLVKRAVFVGYGGKTRCDIQAIDKCVGTECKITITPHGMDGKPLGVSGISLDTTIGGPDEKLTETTAIDNGDGTYRVIFRPKQQGRHNVMIKIYGTPAVVKPNIIDIKDKLKT